MRKIILGLFLTVTVPGIALANTGIEKEVKKNALAEKKDLRDNISEKKIASTNNDEEKQIALFDCYHVTKVRIIIEDWVYDATIDEGPGPCLGDEEDGSIIITLIK